MLPLRRFPPTFPCRSKWLGLAGPAAARPRRQLSRLRCPPKFAVRREIRRHRTRECWVCGRRIFPPREEQAQTLHLRRREEPSQHRARPAPGRSPARHCVRDYGCRGQPKTHALPHLPRRWAACREVDAQPQVRDCESSWDETCPNWKRLTLRCRTRPPPPMRRPEPTVSPSRLRPSAWLRRGHATAKGCAP